MGRTKKFVSLLIAAAMVLTVLTAAPFTVNAAGGVENRLAYIQTVYPDNSYFTVDGNIWESDDGYGCQLSNIPSRGGLPSGAQAAAVTWDAWSCMAFARYVFYCTFGLKPENCISVSPDNISVGDYIRLNEAHSVIYMGEDEDYWYVYDSNFSSTPSNIVRTNGRINKNYWQPSAIYHATNYDEINKTPVKNPQLSVNKSTALLNEALDFSFSAENAVEYTLNIFKNGEKIIEETTRGNSISCSFDRSGDYSAYVTCTGEIDSADTQWVYFTVTSPYEIGDADGNGKVNIFDASTIQLYLAKITPPSIVIDACDVDGDGDINVNDVSLLQMKIAKLIP